MCMCVVVCVCVWVLSKLMSEYEFMCVMAVVLPQRCGGVASLCRSHTDCAGFEPKPL